MTPVAFFAPLKAPTHDTPSGDREIARNLMQALRLAGGEPHLASDLRCLDLQGDPELQRFLHQEALAQVLPCIQMGQEMGWRAWITYHNYYKAPDLLGPKVSEALGIPYIQVESTRARKRLGGPWDSFARASEQAADKANAILYFTQRDAQAVRAYAPAGQTHVHLKPFLPVEELPKRSNRSGSMLSVGMMRPGDKLRSYALIAETLALLRGDWHLNIVGDGNARQDVEKLMAPFGEKVAFLGKLDHGSLAQAYAEASLFFWPGVNEAIGMVYLEAQAAGLKVIAQDRPGLREVLAPEQTCPQISAGEAGLAQAISAELACPSDQGNILDYVAENHLLPGAAKTLKSVLDPLLEMA